MKSLHILIRRFVLKYWPSSNFVQVSKQGSNDIITEAADMVRLFACDFKQNIWHALVMP